MPREPHYPDDAPIGDVTKARKTSRAARGQASGNEGPNAVEGKAEEKSGRTKQIVTGAAIGIGSAAIVAALLYANRRGKNEKA